MGQLGLGDEILSRKKPAIVKELADVKMKKIAAGALHTVCLTHDNKVGISKTSLVISCQLLMNILQD